MKKSNENQKLLDDFADKSDKLLNLGIIRTDSFTGEIGEYIVCKHFGLIKSQRSQKEIDGVCALGNRYQIKARTIQTHNYNYEIRELNPSAFEFLVIIYFDIDYRPLRVIRIPSGTIVNKPLRITNSFISQYAEKVILSAQEDEAVNAISDFGKAFNKLKEHNIIRSRHIVGDIGEMFACERLNLKLNNAKTQKGYDAIDLDGLTYEIKTRRVYDSTRRIDKTRRLNNLINKTAEYLIVVVLNRSFQCSGMWIMPLNNIKNPISAKLDIVNKTLGSKSLVPSQVSWLKDQEDFQVHHFTTIRQGNLDKIIEPFNKNISTVKTLKNNPLPLQETPNLIITKGCGIKAGIGIVFLILYWLTRLLAIGQ